MSEHFCNLRHGGTFCKFCDAEQSPQAVECLPVVGYANLTDIDERSMRRDTWLVETPCKYRATSLTPHAPAQALIERLMKERDSALQNYSIQKRERTRVEGELANCEARIREQRAEINRLATLKARALDVDAVMALAYEKGWRNAAEWAGRDDLVFDIGSPSYNIDWESARAALLAKLKGSE